MNAGKAVYGILSTNAEVTAIVGNKIFPEVAEQETALPLIVYQLQSVAPEDTHDGPSKLDEVRFEFLCYADTYNGAADLGDKVRGALDRVSGTYNAVNVESVQFNDVDIDVIDAPRRYGQSLTFTFRIKRDDVEIAQGTPVTGAMLGDLYNVDVAGVTDNQILSYDAATGNWVPADDAGGLVDSVNGLTGTVILNFDDLNDVDTGTPSDGQLIAYQQGEWVTIDQDEIHIPINSVTGLQTELNTIPTDLSDLSDVSIVGTPAGNQALIYNSATNAFTSQDSYTNRFEDEVETGKVMPTIFAERAYSVKSEGDGVFIDPESDTPAAGKVIVRKIYHKAGFITDADVIGDYTLIHTFADDTAYADTVATFEGFRDGNTYGTPPFTLLQTWAEEAAAPTFTGLLNESYGSGAAAAYGTRRLNGNYSGACMTIRRASDGTTQAIGFVGEEIDESAITTFCTGTTCTVQVWHDQSQTGGTGSGNDAEQTTPANQPTIYTGGALVKDGGRLALDFDGGSDILDASLTIANDFTAIVMGLSSNTTSNQKFICDQTNSKGQLFVNSGNYNWFDGSSVTALQTADTSSHLFFVSANSGGSFVSIDGVDKSITGISNTGYGELKIGGRTISSQYLDGQIQEIIFYPTDKRTDRTNIEGNISAYYQSAKLLDEQFGENAEAAYSTRKLRRAQTDCMVIRRASDSTTQTIGFDGSGNIDEAAINTFCSGTSCTVYQWIDQSGNGNTATAAAQANEPTIYTGGALVKENGRVALDVNDNTLTTSSAITLAADLTMFYVTKKDNTSGGGSVLAWGNSLYAEGYAGQGLPVLSNTVGNQFIAKNSPLNNNFDLSFAASQKLIYTNRRGTTGATALNGSTEKTATATLTSSVTFDAITGNTSGGHHSYDGIVQEAIFYASDKSTDRTSIESNIGGYFTQNTPLLDTYSGAAAAYSLRKLSSSYSGSAIRVRRSSDNTEQDINFNVFGELDTVSLLAFAGAGDAFVKTWYCQSGNSNDATQTTTASQPQIVSSGAVIVENGKPAIQGGKFSFSGVTMTSAGFQVLHVFKNSGQNVWIGNNASNKFSVQYATYGSLAYQGTFTGSRAINGSYVTGQQTLVSVGDNGTKTVASIDGAVAADSTGYPAANLPEVLGRLYNKSFGADLSSDYLVQEIIIYNSDQFSNRTNIENNLNTFYSIY